MSEIGEEPGAVALRLTLDVMPIQTGANSLVRFSLSQAGRKVLRVHDATGREVRTLYASPHGPALRIGWLGPARPGRKKVGAGIFFFRLGDSGRTIARKAMLLR